MMCRATDQCVVVVASPVPPLSATPAIFTRISMGPLAALPSGVTRPSLPHAFRCLPDLSVLMLFTVFSNCCYYLLVRTANSAHSELFHFHARAVLHNTRHSLTRQDKVHPAVAQPSGSGGGGSGSNSRRVLQGGRHGRAAGPGRLLTVQHQRTWGHTWCASQVGHYALHACWPSLRWLLAYTRKDLG